MATIGQPLLQPEASWKRYDDSDTKIIYNGTFTVGGTGNPTKFYNSTVRYSNVLGNSISFDFYGTKLRIVTEANPNRDSLVSINIDGVVETYSEYTATTGGVGMTLVYEKLNLTKKRHKVTISKTQSGTGYFSLDAIDIDSDGHFGTYDKILLSSGNNEILTYSSNMTKYGVSKFGFDEIIGNVTDSKGTSVGTVTGATRVTGWSGQGNALSFNGTSDFVLFNGKVTPLGKQSVRLKVKSSKKGLYQMLLTQTGGSANHGLQMAIETDDTLVVLIGKGVTGTPIFTLKSIKKVTDGLWHDVLFTWDGTTGVNGVKLFIDNMSVPEHQTTANAIQTVTPTYDLVMGKGHVVSTPYYFTGQLDDVEIYNEAITPTKADKEFTKVSSQSEQNFINHGISQSDLASIDMYGDFTEKHYIQDVSTVLGTGKVFEHTLDVNKVLKKIKIK